MKKEYFTIPNLMGYFRILLIPVFLVLYGRAETDQEYLLAFAVLAVSYLTDFLDGKIARRFHMVTDWGKMLDPVADKLTQGALALALLSRYPSMLLFVILFLGKELYMGIMGVYLIKKGKSVHGAQWYGKLCTAVIDGGILVLLLFTDLSYFAGNLLIFVMMVCMLFSLVKYLFFHIRLLKGKEIIGKRRKIWLLAVPALVLYVVIGVAAPYLREPSVSEEYKNSFTVDRFYGSGLSCDRAAVIEDNGEALAERIRLIENAEREVILSTFDFRADIAGKQVMAAMQAAARRGVQVRILADGFNFWVSMEGNPYFYALLKEENIQIKVYNPVNPLVPWKIMGRLHDKYVIADEKLYLLGGRNTFSYFLGDQKGHKNYDRDVLVWNTGGKDSSVYQVLDYFRRMWEQDYCKSWKHGGWLTGLPCVRDAEQELEYIYTGMRSEHGDWFPEEDYEERTVPVNKITLLANPTGIYAKEPQVFYGLCQLMKNAQKEAWIHTPYIMCDEMMYQSFEEICREGVPVTLMTNSSENNGNPFGAVDYVLNKEKILDTGLRVLEYEGGVSYHGKSLVIDEELAIVGSFNMDMKSVYQDTELMLVINGREMNQMLRENLETYQQDSREAVLDEQELQTLLEEASPMEKLQKMVIRVLDPWLRFLM